ncbi:MAG: hypothetical protein Q8876_02285 [Bacillota bacterium]|nr:hypothetical protein [Bacillota bacterium]
MKNKKNNSSDHLANERLKAGPRDVMLSGAEHFFQDDDTKIWHPSDDSVEEMRSWSQDNQK